MLKTVISRFFKAGPPVLAAEGSAVVVLSSGESATFTYILERHLLAQGKQYRHIAADMFTRRVLTRMACAEVVLCRYVSPEWIDELWRFKGQGGKVTYFMDDDLMDPQATVGLPLAYQQKISRFASGQRALLEQLCGDFWVASPYLAAKYASWSPKLLQAVPSMQSLAQARPVTVCYHGTASHLAEIRWLLGIIDELQARRADIHFELFGDHEVNRMFRGIARVSVLHPMSWRNYLSYTRSVRREIALAPLLPHPFNSARGRTKFFDFARMGAVGLYSDVPPYRGFVENGVDGMLLPNDPVVWGETIIALAENHPTREQMAASARNRALALAADSGGETELTEKNCLQASF
jgi:glycosyltransferase involved in cell wall biosynthesis